MALVAANPFAGNFLTGRIYRGASKSVCAPGLNCHSCPAAALACPVGAMQAVAAQPDRFFSAYAWGFVLLIGLILGRAVCGFLCPFGFFQELLHKIPSPKKELFAPLVYVKYLVLLLLVVIFPATLVDFAGFGRPAFCEYLCPAGTLTAGLPLILTRVELRGVLGNLFALKFAVLIAVFVGSVAVYRFFCKMLCPLGAIYALINRFSLYNLRLDEARCVKCGACRRACPMAVDPAQKLNLSECIRCGKCARICPKGAIKLNLR